MLNMCEVLIRMIGHCLSITQYFEHQDHFLTWISFSPQVLFVFIDLDEEDNVRILEFFGLTVDDAPTYRLIHLEDVSTQVFRT